VNEESSSTSSDAVLDEFPPRKSKSFEGTVSKSLEESVYANEVEEETPKTSGPQITCGDQIDLEECALLYSNENWKYMNKTGTIKDFKENHKSHFKHWQNYCTANNLNDKCYACGTDCKNPEQLQAKGSKQIQNQAERPKSLAEQLEVQAAKLKPIEKPVKTPAEETFEDQLRKQAEKLVPIEKPMTMERTCDFWHKANQCVDPSGKFQLVFDTEKRQEVVDQSKFIQSCCKRAPNPRLDNLLKGWMAKKKKAFNDDSSSGESNSSN
jgi:hypothetical protein